MSAPLDRKNYAGHSPAQLHVSHTKNAKGSPELTAPLKEKIQTKIDELKAQKQSLVEKNDAARSSAAQYRQNAGKHHAAVEGHSKNIKGFTQEKTDLQAKLAKFKKKDNE